MGKKIDGFVLSIAVAGAFYLYFRGAFQNRTLALALALLCCVLLTKLLRALLRIASKGKWLQRRRARSCAGSAVMQLACLSQEDARQSMRELLAKSYSGEYNIALVQAPPSTSLSQERLFDAWKAHQGEEKLAICATCRCDDGCRALAANLKLPKVALIDASILAQLIAEHPESMPVQHAAKRRTGLQFKRICHLLINRKNAPRNLLFAAAMLLFYLLTANLFNLFGAMALLLVALISLHRPARPAKLF